MGEQRVVGPSGQKVGTFMTATLHYQETALNKLRRRMTGK